MIVAALAALPAAAPGAVDSSSFYAQREKEIRLEYYWCKHDTSRPSLDSIIRWKNSVNDFINSPTYAAWRKRYVDMTGIRTAVAPCEVQSWAAQQLAASRFEEQRALVAIGMREELVEESTAVARELGLNPRSPVDFARIPFGVSRRVFVRLFKELYPSNDLEDQGACLVSELVPWGGGVFTGAFFFDDAGLLYSYEIQSRPFCPDSVDSGVRPVADQMAAVLQAVAGEPTHIYRVGFFDIVPGRLAVYKTWDRKLFRAQIGFGSRKYRYYAKITITNQQLADEARKARMGAAE